MCSAGRRFMFCSHTTFPVGVWCLVKVKSVLAWTVHTPLAGEAVAAHSSSFLVPSALSKLRHAQELKGRMDFLPLLSYIQGCILKYLTPYLKQHCGNPISTLKNYLWNAFLGQINYREAFCIIVFNSQCNLNMVLVYLL